jgi:bacterioferritin-associated ferredoxin
MLLAARPRETTSVALCASEKVDVSTGPCLDFENEVHYPFGRGHWMYVCICRAVTEQEVKAAIEEGAKTVEAVTAACCAGDDCGACHETIEGLIEDRWGMPGVASGGAGTVHLPVVTERGRAA